MKAQNDSAALKYWKAVLTGQRRTAPQRLCAILALCLLALPAHGQTAADFGGAGGGSVRMGWNGSACTAGRAGDVRYNSAGKYLEFCDGSNWKVTQQVQGTAPPPPVGSGFFVLTGTTYNGNLGGLAGADGKCLTELGTTHTGWMNYATANSRGLLVAAKVHAFLCVFGSCNALPASTTYYFANAGDSTIGGGSFTTDASGYGPNDNVAWTAANYFGGAYYYWSNRGGFSSTSKWENNADNNAGSCTSFTSSSSGATGNTAFSSETSQYRWFGFNHYYRTCDTLIRLICYVNP